MLKNQEKMREKINNQTEIRQVLVTRDSFELEQISIK